MRAILVVALVSLAEKRREGQSVVCNAFGHEGSAGTLVKCALEQFSDSRGAG